MKKIQRFRLISQILFIILSAIGLFVNFKITMFILFIISLFTGPFCCGWICPFGTLQDLLSRVSTLLKIKKIKPPQSLHNILKFSRYILLVLITLLSVDFIFSIISLDPRVNLNSILLGRTSSVLSILVIIVFLLISIFFERPFCNYFCIEGAKHGLLSHFRFITVKRDSDKCINCNQCNKICPMNIKVTATEEIKSMQCINCFECITVCPVEKTMSFGFVKIRDKAFLKSILSIKSLIIVSILLISFLGFSILGALDNDKENDMGNKSLGVNPEIVDLENKDDVEDIEEEIIKPGENLVFIEEDIIKPDETAVFIEEQNGVDPIVEEVQEVSIVEEAVLTGRGMGFISWITVSVTIVNDLITEIVVTDHNDDYKWFNRAYPMIPNRIIESQSTDIDVVSGATYSSLGIIDAVKDAMGEE